MPMLRQMAIMTSVVMMLRKGTIVVVSAYICLPSVYIHRGRSPGSRNRVMGLSIIKQAAVEVIKKDVPLTGR